MKKIKIAITGGLGSGKSVILSIIASRGYPVFSCDQINQDLLSDPAYIQKIEECFPGTTEKGQIIKSRLAKTVFCDKNNLQRLNKIAHPLILSQLFQKIANTDAQLNFAEVPLLFEFGYENLFDFVIIVFRTKNVRIQAVKDRDGIDEKMILAKINNQYNYEQLQKSNLSDKYFIIDNNENLDILSAKVDIVLAQIIQYETLYVKQKE